MASTIANGGPRRQPRQARAAERRQRFLDAAAVLIGQVGYDAATMTEIAARAAASIGALYDYFPDKQALALALMASYTEELDVQWKHLLVDLQGHSAGELAETLIEGMLSFVSDRPAYLPLMSAPVAYARSAAARQPLRRTIADALQRVNPKMTSDYAFLVAQVVVELIKGLLSIYKQAAARDKALVTGEFKALMKLYLASALS